MGANIVPKVNKNEKHQKPMLSILAKVHKSPWKTHPVVGRVGSLLAAVSTWLDFHLQKLRKFLPSSIKDCVDL
eukprot:1976651-Ditylum_brightwellii.AAC.1